MPARRPYSLIYAPIFREHLKLIEVIYHSLIRQEIEKHLLFEPETEAQNRKPLRRPAILGARWEIRFGPGNRFRDFYRVIQDTHHVHILALGEKKGNLLLIGGKELEL